MIEAKEKGSMIRTRKDEHDVRIYKLHAASNDASSQHNKENRNRAQKIKLDTDYFSVGVDTHISHFMSNNIDHFKTCVSNNRHNKVRIKVADGSSMDVKGRGMETWKIDDDDGVVHVINIKIKGTLCVPKLDLYLLSPHHVAP